MPVSLKAQSKATCVALLSVLGDISPCQPADTNMPSDKACHSDKFKIKFIDIVSTIPS